MNIQDYRKKKLGFKNYAAITLIPLWHLSIYDKKDINNKKVLKNWIQEVLIKQDSWMDAKINGWKYDEK